MGHRWNKLKDTLSLKFNPVRIPQHQKITKRFLLGQVAKLWDPFGWLLPVSMPFRTGIQKLWQEGYGWDEVISDFHIETWNNHFEQMMNLRDLEFTRCLKPKGVVGLPQLHAFSDGGNDAFGTCVFIRWNTESGIKISFVTAKAFVAPSKRKTIPRVELMGAVAMSRLTSEIRTSLGYKFEHTRFWIDSQIVLYWLLSESNLYRPFISTRT